MSTTQKDLITTRGYLPEDRSFILACWLRGLYYGNTFFSEIPKNIFMEHYHQVLEKFLDNPNVNIAVSCLKDDPQVILGYSVSRVSAQGDGILDWVFVKTAWRNIGIAKSLVPNNFKWASHTTKLGRALKPAHVTYNPFI
jgi:hypothetical protein